MTALWRPSGDGAEAITSLEQMSVQLDTNAASATKTEKTKRAGTGFPVPARSRISSKAAQPFFFFSAQIALYDMNANTVNTSRKPSTVQPVARRFSSLGSAVHTRKAVTSLAI